MSIVDASDVVEVAPDVRPAGIASDLKPPSGGIRLDISARWYRFARSRSRWISSSCCRGRGRAPRAVPLALHASLLPLELRVRFALPLVRACSIACAPRRQAHGLACLGEEVEGPSWIASTRCPKSRARSLSTPCLPLGLRPSSREPVELRINNAGRPMSISRFREPLRASRPQPRGRLAVSWEADAVQHAHRGRSSSLTRMVCKRIGSRAHPTSRIHSATLLCHSWLWCGTAIGVPRPQCAPDRALVQYGTLEVRDLVSPMFLAPGCRLVRC